MSTRHYDINTRNKLPRNKYGIINNNTVGESNSVFGGATGLSSNTLEGTSVISLDMIDLDSFKGATDLEDGYKGIVPAPLAGMQDWFLKGDAKWTRIPAYEWLHEFPASEGLEKSGLELKGNLNVTDTITANNLEVTGAAHFWELVIDEVKAQGGQILISPSMFQVDFVGEYTNVPIFDSESKLFQLMQARTDIYNILQANNVEYVRCVRLYQRNDDGEKQTENECHIGDMMRCRSFNIKEGPHRNIYNVDYWSFVCNEGEDYFTDVDRKEYSCFWIDLAVTLRKKDGHNIPLGSILNIDGTCVYPEGYTEITDALELKKTSQEAWNGSRDVEDEFFENQEWTDIQEKVIDIRGLDDQIIDLTGRNATNRLSDSDINLIKTRNSTSLFMDGVTTDTSVEDITTMTLNGQSSGSSSDGGLDSVEEQEALDLAASTLNNGTEIKNIADLKINRKVRSELVLETNTVTSRDFVAGANLYDENNNLIYAVNHTIPAGTTTRGDWKVIDFDEDTAYKYIIKDDITTEITGHEKEVIDTFTDTTSSGVDREVDSFMEEQKYYSEKTSWQFGYVKWYPCFRVKAGDKMACLGHLYDSERQNAIVLSSTNPIDPELDAPAIAQYSHLDTFGVSISDFRQTAIAANGNEFFGQFFINYKDTFVNINERIDMMINDVETGLESVGIHLDGQNSTMKLVGSVELHQHDQKNSDTLSVFDSLGNKKVEIIPKAIPLRSDDENPINNNRNSFSTFREKKNAGKEYITYDKKKVWNSPFTYSWVYTYILNNYVLNITTSATLGNFKQNYILDLGGLNLRLLYGCNLVGNSPATWYGDTSKILKSITYTIKRNGVALQGVTNVELKGNENVSVFTSENVGQMDISSSTFLNDYIIPIEGTYTVEFNIKLNIYAWCQGGNRYDNYYYTIDSGLSGFLESSVQGVQLQNAMNLTKMTIGTNGMYFYGNNSRYFYAAEDGFEFRWDDARFILDSTNGITLIPLAINIESGYTVDPKYSIVKAKYVNGGYDITLPKAHDYGDWREITILAEYNLAQVPEPHIKIKTQNGELIYLSTFSSTTIEFGSGGSNPKISLKLISTGNAWMGISCL